MYVRNYLDYLIFDKECKYVTPQIIFDLPKWHFQSVSSINDEILQDNIHTYTQIVSNFVQNISLFWLMHVINRVTNNFIYCHLVLRKKYFVKCPELRFQCYNYSCILRQFSNIYGLLHLHPKKSLCGGRSTTVHCEHALSILVYTNSHK